MAKNMKKKEIIDTNVLIRFLVADNKEQFNQAKNYFHEAEIGKRKLVITPLVIAETCFVLESFYKKTKKEIAGTIETLLLPSWLIVEQKEILLSLLNWYRQGLHFVDSYLLAWAKINQGEILSFDKQIRKKRNGKIEI
jgi:predicted nucleic-acid-binding protein